MDIETLEKLVNAKIAAIKERVDGIEKVTDARLNAMDKALEVANQELQRRFEQIDNLEGKVSKDRINYANKDVTKIIAFVYFVLLLGVALLAALK